MLHEEVKLQLGKFLSETPLDFDDQSDLMSSLNTHFMSTLGIPFGQRQSYCLAALQNKSVSIITLRRGSEIVHSNPPAQSLPSIFEPPLE